MSIQNLRERRSALAKNLHDMVDKNTGNGAWKPEHQSIYDQSMAEIEGIDGDIKRINATLGKIGQESVNEHLDRVSHDTKSKGVSMYARWLKAGDTGLSAQDWADIRNVTSTTTGSEGGFSVQTDVAATIIEGMKAYGGMREVSTVIVTDQGNPLSYPTSDGTTEEGELIAENASATVLDPVFGTVSLNTFKFGSKIVAIPYELMQDSRIDIEAFVNARFVQRLGRITNRMATTGTGTGQPRGAATAATAGKTGAVGSTLTASYDDIVDLIHSIDPAYRVDPSTAFMLNDLSLRNLRKIKDSTGRPIFYPGFDGLGAPMPDTILGYRAVVNQDVAVMAANAKSILFGAFSKYIIRDAMAVNMFRFTDSVYVSKGQIGFLAWMRSGGNLVDALAVKAYVNSAT